MSNTKIFCIGFQKTGTSSMGKALKILGYKVTGPNGINDPAIAIKVYQEAKKLTKKFDAFQDNPWPVIYKWCYENYPDAKFILTVRDPDKWYTSSLRHFGTKSTCMREWIYGATHGSPANNRDCWIQRYTSHNVEVTEFFKDKPNFLMIDVTQGDGWDKVCPFLGKPIPGMPFPHANPARVRGPKKSPSFLNGLKRTLLGRTRVW